MAANPHRSLRLAWAEQQNARIAHAALVLWEFRSGWRTTLARANHSCLRKGRGRRPVRSSRSPANSLRRERLSRARHDGIRFRQSRSRLPLAACHGSRVFGQVSPASRPSTKASRTTRRTARSRGQSACRSPARRRSARGTSARLARASRPRRSNAPSSRHMLPAAYSPKPLQTPDPPEQVLTGRAWLAPRLEGRVLHRRSPWRAGSV